MPGSVRIHNLDVVMSNIKSIGSGAPKYMVDVLMRCMTEDLWPKWIEHINIQDHSLEDLRKLGHPYSTQFGADTFVHPDSQVHTQSGDLMDESKIVQTLTANGPAVQLINTSPHYIFLRYGTMTMRMRDPGGSALAEALPAIRHRIKVEVKDAIFKLYAR